LYIFVEYFAELDKKNFLMVRIYENAIMDWMLSEYVCGNTYVYQKGELFI
jgi:hypothetical protein